MEAPIDMKFPLLLLVFLSAAKKPLAPCRPGIKLLERECLEHGGRGKITA